MKIRWLIFGAVFILVLPLRSRAEEPKKALPTKEQAAKSLYAEGALSAKRGLYLDAVKAFEECLRLDADAVPPRRMLASLYVTVGRPDDAVAMAKTVTEKAPGDFEAWRQYAYLLHDLGKTKDAVPTLLRAVECESAATYPDQLTDMLSRLGEWARKINDLATTEAAQRKRLAVLDQNRERFRNNGLLNDDDFRTEKAGTFERLGEAQLAANKLDDAVVSFEESRKTYAECGEKQARLADCRLHWRLAEIQQARHDPRAALEHLLVYLKNVKTTSLEPFRLLVDLLQQVDRDSTVRILSEYAERDKANLPLQLFLAETMGNAGQIQSAENLYAELLKKNAKSEVYSGLFHLYERSNNAPAVLRKLDEHGAVLDDEQNDKKARKNAAVHVRAMTAALMKQPALIMKLLPLADKKRFEKYQQNASYETYQRLAQLALRSDQLDEAERLFRAAAADGRNEPGWVFRVSNDYALLQLLLARQEYQDVVAHCRKRIQNRDQHSNVGENKFLYFRYLEKALVLLGDLNEAQQINEQAIELARNEELIVRSRLERAELLLLSDKSDAALAECDQLLKEHSQVKFTRMIQYKKATILSQLRRFAESEKILRQMLEQDPNDAVASNFLGYELASQNRNLDEAERLIRRAIELDRQTRRTSDPDLDEDEEVIDDNDNAAFLDSLAWALFRKGKLAEARHWLETATTQSDGREEPTLWDHLGDVYYRTGESAKAREAWTKAQQFYPKDPIAKKDGRLDEVGRKLKLPK